MKENYKLNLIGTIVYYLLNLIFIVILICAERKSPSSVVAWAIVVTVIPIFGFILYLVFGNNLSLKTRIMLKKKKIKSKELKEAITNQISLIDKGEAEFTEIEDKYKQLIRYNMSVGHCLLTSQNDVKIFNDANEFLSDLLLELDKAKKNINLCSYILAYDEIGKILIKKLEEKAKQGVEVNLLYDAVGSLSLRKRHLKPLKKAGAKIASFFPSKLGLSIFNLKINYRNHRKIIVIDNVIGYTGGLNFRADHFGKRKKLFPWIDMHLKIKGEAVSGLQTLFLQDWRYAYKKRKVENDDINSYFEKDYSITTENGGISMQILSSGPDEDNQTIKDAMIKMILQAKKKIVLESPYFVPDESFMTALTIAHNSGVDVSLVLPEKADRKVVYYSCLAFIREIVLKGIKVYFRKGFIHSKCLLIDDEIVSIGTTNADIRSFKLNFEVTAIIYNEKISKRVAEICQNDINNSILIDYLFFKQLPYSKKFAKSFCRLFSSIL